MDRCAHIDTCGPDDPARQIERSGRHRVETTDDIGSLVWREHAAHHNAAHLATLQSVEPSFHVVIFTQFKSTHASVVQMIRRQMPEAKLFEFTGSTACKRRHDYIREFQDTSPPMWGGRREPKVFVITMRAGAVG